MSDIQIHERIKELEVKVDSLKESIEDITKNHLPHLYTKLNKIEKKLAYYAGGIFVGITLVEFFFKFLK